MTKASCLFIASAAALLFVQACATFPQEQQMRSMARVYDSTYDRVWESTVDMLRGDLKCIFKKNDKQDGFLETEWAHRMDTEGRKRWMVRAQVRKVKSGVEVAFFKKLDLQDPVSKSLDRYKKSKNDPADAASGGWKKSEIDLTGVDELYRLLERRLAAQE